jgi:hypothetical protein
VLGALGVLIAAWGTGNHLHGVPRRVAREQREPLVVERR